MKTLSISVIAGIIISLALFWLMQTMISNNQQQRFNKTDNLQMTEFVRLKRETKLQAKNREIPDEPPPEKHPPPPKMQMQQVQVNQTPAPQMDMPNLDIPLQTDRFSGSLLGGIQINAGKISSNVIPLLRIPPRYPMRAANRHIEGWVKIEFTITEQGTVKDPVIVDSQPSKIFDRAALQAIKRWKFKAKIIGGEAFEQRAIQTLQFKLSK
ncbi:MAG: energy transducer TonB [Methylococcales bacterium]|nr:energy transducer TonB [Methylococcales bacterium]